MNHCTTRESRLTQILKMKVYGPRAGSIRSFRENNTVFWLKLYGLRKYTVLKIWKYAVLLRKVYGLSAKTILSAKVYSPQNLKGYRLIKKSIRSFSENYTVCESIRSWIIDELYDAKAESIRSWSWFTINESYDEKAESIRSGNWFIINESNDVNSGKYTVLDLTHNQWVIRR